MQAMRFDTMVNASNAQPKPRGKFPSSAATEAAWKWKRNRLPAAGTRSKMRKERNQFRQWAIGDAKVINLGRAACSAPIASIYGTREALVSRVQRIFYSQPQISNNWALLIRQCCCCCCCFSHSLIIDKTILLDKYGVATLPHITFFSHFITTANYFRISLSPMPTTEAYLASCLSGCSTENAGPENV